MTATHHCETCKRKTTHRVLTGKTGTEAEGLTAIECVVCGTMVHVEIKDE